MKTKTRKQAADGQTVKKSAIDVATEELDALVKAQSAGTAKPEDPAEMLTKAADEGEAAAGKKLRKGQEQGDGEGPGGQVISGGKGGQFGEGGHGDGNDDGAEEEPEDEEEEEEEVEEEGDEGREKSLRGAFYDSLLDDERFGEVMEASPALEHMTTVMGKSFEFVAQQNAALQRNVQRQAQQIDTLIKGLAVTQRALAMFIKSQAPGLVGLTKSMTPGVMGRTGVVLDQGHEGSNGKALSKGDVVAKIERAMADGKLPSGSDVLMALDGALGFNALARIPAEVRKSYNIPDPPQGS